MGRRGIRKIFRSVDEARRAWVAIVPEDVSSHSRVASLRQGVLYIEVDSPPLCFRLAGFEKERLLQDLQVQAKSVTITGLCFRLGSFS